MLKSLSNKVAGLRPSIKLYINSVEHLHMAASGFTDMLSMIQGFR